MESNDPKKGRKRLAITMGDPAGIGAEISVKALNKTRPSPSSSATRPPSKMLCAFATSA